VVERIPAVTYVDVMETAGARMAFISPQIETLLGYPSERFLADAKVLQDLLGEQQDAAVAQQRLRAATVVDSPTAAAFVAGRLAERRRAHRTTLSRRLPEAWKRLRRSGANLG
jgi:CHAD domain-containing protein